MKPLTLGLLGVAALALSLAAGRGPRPAAAAQPEKAPASLPNQPGKDAEPLPPAPKADPGSKHIANPAVPGLIVEVLPDNKTRRVLVEAEVCLRDGPLEVLLCKANTKEHEAVVRTAVNAERIYEVLKLAGGVVGTPVQYVDPKTGEAQFKPPTGSKVRVLVHYKKDGKLHTHPAQEWVWNKDAKKPLAHDWVFAGSRFFKDADRPNAPPYFTANSGDVIAIANFPDAMLDMPVEIGKDDANLQYEARTDRIPPLLSKVWLILEPVAAK